MIYVTKADGSKQPFDKSKVIRTCLRMHATEQQAREVANKIEKKIYDGIPTNKLLKMIFTFLKEYRPEVAHRIDLREAISLLRPKPDFEVFVLLLLKEFGYSVTGSQLIKGRCVEHEIDAIALKDSQVTYVEVKHHFMHHTYTGLSVFLEAQAVFEDLMEGYSSGKNRINFNKALVVCNTKFSEHALQYAGCKGIDFIGWSAPADLGLEQMIEEKKLYPITLLKNLEKNIEEKLGDAGVVLLKQLVEYNIDELWRKTRVPKDKLENLVKKAKELLSG
jgi:Holliday junction resolvase-like predicted endonuclease